MPLSFLRVIRAVTLVTHMFQFVHGLHPDAALPVSKDRLELAPALVGYTGIIVRLSEGSSEQQGPASLSESFEDSRLLDNGEETMQNQSLQRTIRILFKQLAEPTNDSAHDCDKVRIACLVSGTFSSLAVL